MHALRRRARAELPKPPQTVVAHAPKVGSVGEYRGAVAAKPFCVRNANVAGRQETLAVTPRNVPSCSTNSHPAVQTVRLAVLIQRAGPVAQYFVTRELEVHFPRPGRSRETRPVRLVYQRDDPTLTSNRLVSGFLLHVESLKRSRNVVLRNVVPGGGRGEIDKHILRRPRWQLLRQVALAVGVGTGLAAWYRNAPATIHSGHVGG